MKLYFAVLLAFIKELPLRARVTVANWIRGFLFVNDNMRDISAQMNVFGAQIQSTNNELFALFHAAPFFGAILTLDANAAAKMINTKIVEQNGLIPLLTSIVLAMRQGETSLQINGELSEFVRAELTKRKFKIEQVQGSNDNTGLFILWT